MQNGICRISRWRLFFFRIQIGHFTAGTNEIISYLNVTAIQTNDGGLYKCTATSKVGSAEHAARYNVYGLPFVKPMDKAAVVAGETMIVTCPVAGYPIETIVWEKAGRTLPVNRRQQVFQNGTLIIENVQRQADQGAYNCIAKNSQGFSAKGSLDVQVMGKTQSSFTFFTGEEKKSRPATQLNSASRTKTCSTFFFTKM